MESEERLTIVLKYLLPPYHKHPWQYKSVYKLEIPQTLKVHWPLPALPRIIMQQANLFVFIANAPILKTQKGLFPKPNHVARLPSPFAIIHFRVTFLQKKIVTIWKTHSVQMRCLQPSVQLIHIFCTKFSRSNRLWTQSISLSSVFFKSLHHNNSIGAAWFLESIHSPVWSYRPHELWPKFPYPLAQVYLPNCPYAPDSSSRELCNPRTSRALYVQFSSPLTTSPSFPNPHTTRMLLHPTSRLHHSRKPSCKFTQYNPKGEWAPFGEWIERGRVNYQSPVTLSVLDAGLKSKPSELWISISPSFGKWNSTYLACC